MTASRLDQICTALSHALAAAFPGDTAPAAVRRLPADALVPLDDRGLAHDHIRLGDSGMLARVPKQSQLGLSPAANLAYQQANFLRCAPAGTTPRLHGVLAPSPDLPMGALIVDAVTGRPVRLPDDLPALARCLAAIHALPVPGPEAWPPLPADGNGAVAELETIRAQAPFLERDPDLHPEARRRIAEEVAWANTFVGSLSSPPPTALILTDTHPGNFLVTAAGDAVIVDLEKARYGSPPIDLAHTSVYTSTTWDVAAAAVLNPDQVAGFYQAWAEAAGPTLAMACRPWHLPLRRLLWIRAATWCVKWRVLHRADRRTAPERSTNAEDWSAANSEAALIAHVADRVDHYLDPATIARCQADWLDPGGLPRLLDGCAPTD